MSAIQLYIIYIIRSLKYALDRFEVPSNASNQSDPDSGIRIKKPVYKIAYDAGRLVLTASKLLAIMA